MSSTPVDWPKNSEQANKVTALPRAAGPDDPNATIYADAGSEAPLLREIGNAYPNITMIRVRDAIDRVSEVLSGIAAATKPDRA